MAHLGVWIEWWLKVARELAVDPKSPAYDELHEIAAEWETRGDELNARYQAEWAALPMAEVRRRFSTLPGRAARLSDRRAGNALAQGPRAPAGRCSATRPSTTPSTRPTCGPFSPRPAAEQR